MVERLYEIRKSFIRALPDMEKIPVNGLSNNEWQMSPDLIKILQPLESLTRVLCGVKYASISMIIPSVGATLEFLKDFHVDSRDILAFRAILYDRLRERFSNIETNEIMSVATILDPRFKASGRFNSVIYF